MALAATTKATVTAMSGSDGIALLNQYNKLAADVQAIITAAATNIAAVAAVVPTAGLIADNNGNTTF